MTDEEIVKAFEHCNKSLPHDKCLLAEQHKEDWVTCQSKCGRMIIDFIQRQKAEIERLTEEVESIVNIQVETCERCYKSEQVNVLEGHIKELKENHEERLAERQKVITALCDEKRELQKQVDELTELKTVKTVDGNGLRITFFHKTKKVGVASVCDYQGREDNFLHGVEVKEQYRGQGYGRKIVEYMTTHYPVDTLYVEKANNSAIRLYERFGFALTCDTFGKDGKTMAVMARGNELYKQAVKDTAEKFAERLGKCVVDDFTEYEYGYLCMRIDEICEEITVGNYEKTN